MNLIDTNNYILFSLKNHLFIYLFVCLLIIRYFCTKLRTCKLRVATPILFSNSTNSFPRAFFFSLSTLEAHAHNPTQGFFFLPFSISSLFPFPLFLHFHFPTNFFDFSPIISDSDACSTIRLCAVHSFVYSFRFFVLIVFFFFVHTLFFFLILSAIAAAHMSMLSCSIFFFF